MAQRARQMQHMRCPEAPPFNPAPLARPRPPHRPPPPPHRKEVVRNVMAHWYVNAARAPSCVGKFPLSSLPARFLREGRRNGEAEWKRR